MICDDSIFIRNANNREGSPTVVFWLQQVRASVTFTGCQFVENRAKMFGVQNGGEGHKSITIANCRFDSPIPTGTFYNVLNGNVQVASFGITVESIKNSHGCRELEIFTNTFSAEPKVPTQMTPQSRTKDPTLSRISTESVTPEDPKAASSFVTEMETETKDEVVSESGSGLVTPDRGGQGQKGLTTAHYAGIGVGAAVVVGIIVVTIWFLHRRKVQQRKAAEQEAVVDPNDIESMDHRAYMSEDNPVFDQWTPEQEAYRDIEDDDFGY
jgi:hypothetical protein